MASTSSPFAPQLMSQVETILRQLTASPYPVLESQDPSSTTVSPATSVAPVKRRASVAFVIRIQPSYAHWPNDTSDTRIDNLDDFFRQEWVQHGDPEVLFIKRASRKGDRWTSHIALPGGKRDPEDADDQAAAVRETWEEVGLDLTKHAIECGNLPQRLVTTHWGKKPLMVLCPYVFLLTNPSPPSLKLQPTEVAATHWVPIRTLLSPRQRTVAFEDVSSRLANQETGVRKWMLSLILGKMMFAAISLLPTESLHSAETPAPDSSSSIQLQDNRYPPSTLTSRATALASRLYRSDIFDQFPPPAKEGPLLLWGLTLGVVSDFLDLIPPHRALTLWTYPTFTPLDVRFVVWLLTYRFKHRKRAELQAGSQVDEKDVLHRPAFGGVSESLASSLPGVSNTNNATPEDITSSTVMVDRQNADSEADPEAQQQGQDRPDETGLHGLGTGSGVGDVKNRKAAVATMLEGCVDRLTRAFLPQIVDRGRYYDIVRRAVAVALVGRLGAVILLVMLIRRRGLLRLKGGRARVWR